MGEQVGKPTFDDALLKYDAKPAEAKKLLRLMEYVSGKNVEELTPNYIKSLGKQVIPDASTDTWWREIVTPIRSVINNAHEDGLCGAIKVRPYSTEDRHKQDLRRGKTSRKKRKAGSREWLRQFSKHADVHNAALAEFMFETAARIGQAVQVKPEDLDLADNTVLLPASKGHPPQHVAISASLALKLANLPEKRPRPRRGGEQQSPLLFGYMSSTGMHAKWRRICKAAEIPHLSPHEAGRHGFYTELRVRQGLDPITVAEAGRWTDPALPDRTYAHSETDERELRERIQSGGLS